MQKIARDARRHGASTLRGDTIGVHVALRAMPRFATRMACESPANDAGRTTIAPRHDGERA